MTSLFQAPNEAALLRLILDFPLAWVVSHGGDAFAATPLPLVAERDAEGRLVSLVGHLPRANPQVAVLAAEPEALVLFQGPQGYISTSLVSDPASAPTWNYAVARFVCRIEFRPDENDRALRMLTAQAEAAHGTDWSVEKMGARYASMQKRIVAFRAHILSRHVTFKLGQDERPADFAAIVAGLRDPLLAGWMQAAVVPDEG